MGIETALYVVAASAVASTASNLKAASQERKASRAQNRIASRRRQREQLAQVRQNQIAAAQGSQGSATGGTLDSSGFRGSTSSIQSTTAGNLAFTNQIQGLQDYSASRLEKASKLGGYATVFDTVGKIASTGIGGGGGEAPLTQKPPVLNN